MASWNTAMQCVPPLLLPPSTLPAIAARAMRARSPLAQAMEGEASAGPSSTAANRVQQGARGAEHQASSSGSAAAHQGRQRRKKRASRQGSAGQNDRSSGNGRVGRRAFDTILSGNGGEAQQGHSDDAMQGGYYNEYDDNGALGHGADASSIFSHVSLDQAPTYGRLVAAHVLSLLPCLALLLATFMLVWHAPCHVQHHPDNKSAERKACRRLLSDRVSLSAFGIGIVCWLAAHALRPALWKVMESSISLKRAATHEKEQERQEEHRALLDNGQETQSVQSIAKLQSAETAMAILFILFKTIALEMLRVFSVLLANALVIAGLVRTPYYHGEQKNMTNVADSMLASHQWHLHWYDPRFTVGVWVAIGWAIIEFVVTSWQMFDRLALYQSDFDTPLVPGDAEAASMNQPHGYGSTAHTAWPGYELHAKDTRQQYLNVSDSEGTASHSDSAATVRAASPRLGSAESEMGESTLRQVDESSTRVTPGEQPNTNSSVQSTSQRARAPAEVSGFSLSPSEFQSRQLRQEVEEDERDAKHWCALREKLDAEMESLRKARSRVELEQTFGQPLTSVPIVLCTLWRIDGWLWNLGSTLLMSASVTLAQGTLVEDKHAAAPQLFPPVASSKITLLGLIALHTFFTSVWTLALPRLGFAAVTYTSMLVGIGLCLAASARWGLLV